MPYDRRTNMNHRPLIHRALVVLASAAVVVTALASCAAPPGGAVKAGIIASDKPRLAAASLDQAQVPILVEGNTAFALDLYRALGHSGENLFYSPYSISVALAMTYAGARGDTEAQMAQALHYTLPQAQLHAAFNALDQFLLSRADAGDEEAFRLHMANTTWGQRGYSWLEAFLDTLAENYGAGLYQVDFSQPEEARRLINEWVAEQTEGRIEELLPPGAVDGQTAMVLTNAVYFKAAWKFPFAEEATQDGPFHLLDGSQVTVPTMYRLADFGYAEDQGVQALELPYAGDQMSMVILLPQAGTFESFVQALDAQQLAALLGRLEPAGVALRMPRFRFQAEYELKDALTRLGMVDAFGSDADFSGMDGTKELFIDQVYHEAFVALDEAGTEATGATAVVVARKGMPLAQHELTINRPFIFLIRDIETGTILFLGHLVNPAA
jgi:serpin B